MHVFFSCSSLASPMQWAEGKENGLKMRTNTSDERPLTPPKHETDEVPLEPSSV